MTRLVNIFSGLRERGQSLACAPPVFNCMSEIPPAPSPRKEIIAPRQESIAEEFADDPPDAEPHYAEARLWLVARDPKCLFSYWEFRLAEHPDAVGTQGRARFFLRIYRENGEVESIAEIQPVAGNAFVPAGRADTGYFAELGFFTGGIWCFLARSGETRTPPELAALGPAHFATIPARISLGKFRDALASSALPGESLAATAARIQSDARQHGEWTPEHERLLAEILGEDVAAASPSASSLTLTQRIQRRLEAAANAAAVTAPMAAPEAGGEVASPAANWPTSSGAAPHRYP